MPKTLTRTELLNSITALQKQIKTLWNSRSNDDSSSIGPLEINLGGVALPLTKPVKFKDRRPLSSANKIHLVAIIDDGQSTTTTPLYFSTEDEEYFSADLLKTKTLRKIMSRLPVIKK